MLQLLSRPLTATQDAIVGLEYVADLLSRYRLHLDTYRIRLAENPEWSAIFESASSDVLKHFEDHCVKMYSKVIDFQLRLACHYARDCMIRCARGMSLRDDWSGILEDIRKHDIEARLHLSALDSARLLGLVQQSQHLQRSQIRQSLCCDFSTGKDRLPSPVSGNKRSHRFTPFRRLKLCRYLRVAFADPAVPGMEVRNGATLIPCIRA